MWRFRKILLFNDIDEKNMPYTWKALYPNDESSTTVLVYDDSGKRIYRHVTLTKDEFSNLHIDARSERTLNSIMAKELAREKREIEEAEKKADERSALRRSEFASAKVNWPDKTIWNHKVSVHMHSDGRICDNFFFGCSKSPHIGINVNVCAPSDATPKDLKKIVVERHNKMMDKGIVPPYVPKEFAAAGSSSGSDSDGGSRRGYRSRRRGRKLRKQTRKH